MEGEGTMPRFHFDVRLDREPLSPDWDGVELRSAEEAHSEAVHLAFALGQETPPKEGVEVRVRDGDTEELCTCIRLTLHRWAREAGSVSIVLAAAI
jgi:hypothetical protein